MPEHRDTAKATSTRVADSAPSRRPGPAASLDLAAKAAPLASINETVLTFARSETAAALAHFHALSKVKSPAEFVKLQVGEFQRAADASLACLNAVVTSAGRLGGSGGDR